MRKVILLMLFFSHHAISDWMFRGEPNNWTETPMQKIAPGIWESIQVFELGQDEFKVAHRSGWLTSFPQQNFKLTTHGQFIIQFDEITKNIEAKKYKQRAWQFRGTPNQWGTTAMQAVGEGMFKTCQRFAVGDDFSGPRFKIAREDWQFAYPDSDFQVANNTHYEIQFNEQTLQVSVHPVPQCEDGGPLPQQLTLTTLVNQAINIEKRYFEGRGVNHIEALQLEAGQDYRLDESLVIPNTDFLGTVDIPVLLVDDLGETHSTKLTLHVVNPRIDRQLIIHEEDILHDHVDFSLTRVFEHFAEQTKQGQSAIDLFRQFWDVQNSRHDNSTGPSCDDETLQDGFSPAVNGFPFVCDRREGAVVKGNDDQVRFELSGYIPIAAVNRLDLHAQDFTDCGEMRMVFARRSGFGGGRNFMIFEARMPNPTVGDIAGCMPLAQLWLGLTDQSDAEIAQTLQTLFFEGLEAHKPVFSVAHFVADTGQIRTNQFLSPSWVLREHKMLADCTTGPCDFLFRAENVKENPFGPLFNGDLPQSQSEFFERAQAFQTQFIDRIATLITDDFSALKLSTDPIFNNGQSHASGHIIENQFDTHFREGGQNQFAEQLQASLVSARDANHEPLSVEQVLNRAKALTCAGCHQPGTFGLTRPGSLGAMRLPDGSIIDAMPFSNNFVHINEFANRAGNFSLSQAMRDVFLPTRMHRLSEFLEEASQAKF